MTNTSKPFKSHGRIASRTSIAPRELMQETPDLASAWRAKIITLFPQAFPGVLGESLTGRALQEAKWQLETINLRDFGVGKHKNVDDTPSGGGAGMVIRADVMGEAIDHAQSDAPEDRSNWPLVYLSPRGKRFDQTTARRWSQAQGITMICGRFEGVDERVLYHYGIEEVSLGDFVMTGGDLAAQAMIDATVRLLPGVVGNAESLEEESHSSGLLEHPQFTRPAQWRDLPIPDVLTSGDHGKVAEWRQKMAEKITQERRPDMWDAYKEMKD